ncbi:alpha/beta fold hydrolase [Bacillus sp. MRMR6]|uniref:alpha/beta fold hydrolase n=1 Tax=Bacillus sp. MRMR6 TaxID=1928617 RepID=UPI0009529B37|nr:alpha/beta hydrolase [Bacillus sp. MRMR6]OLS40884.1 alpha/beta hydrolase [Bacillus sp. MRMR6]
MEKHLIYKDSTGKQALANDYEHYLEQIGVDFERSYVQTSFGNTHVLVAGPKDGKPLFIFQGGNCINPMTLSWFTPLLKEYRVYAPDTIGHPGFSDENRISAKDASFAQWISELMAHFQIPRSAFLGPSYGGGITLRLAAHMPEKIACAILVCPAGIQLGSKWEMIKKILVPLMLYKITDKKSHMNKIADIMSERSMKELDKEVISHIFKHVKLEQDMPKLTTKEELIHYSSPTMVITGRNDVFFPAEKVSLKAKEIIPNLKKIETIDMGHFPSEHHLVHINRVINEFLDNYY